MALATLTIDLDARLASLEQGLNRAGQLAANQASRIERSFSGVKNVFLGLGAALSVRELGGFVKSAIDTADQLGKVSQRVGITVESLSALKYGAELSDISFEELTSALGKFSKAIDTAAPEFERLKLDPKQFKSTEEGLAQVFEAISKIEDGAAKTAIMMGLFGKELGSKLIPFANGGAESLKQFTEEARRLGIVVSGEAAAAAEKFNDNLTRLQNVSRGLAQTLASNMLPALNQIAEAALDTAQKYGLLSAALSALSQVGKIVLFGVDATAIEQQIKFVAELRKEIEGLKASVNETPAVDDFGNIIGFDPSTAKRRVAELEITLKNAEKALDLMRNPEKDKPKNKAIGRDELNDAKAGENALESRLKGLQRELEAAQQLTEVEKSLAALRRGEFGKISTTDKNKLIDQSALVDAAKREREEREASFAAIATRREIAIAGERQLAQQRNEILDDYYARAQLSDQQYYDAKLATALAEINAEREANEEAILAQRGRIETAKPGDKKGAEQELAKLLAERERLESEANFAGVKAAREIEAAQKRLGDAIRDVNIQLLEQQGKSGAAAAARFDAQNEEFKKRLEAGNEGGKNDQALADLARLREITIARGKLNDVERSGSKIQQDLAIQEERIRNSQEVGAINELEALQRLGKVRSEAVEKLKAYADARERIAQSVGDEAEIQAVQKLRAEIESLAASADLIGDKFRTLFQDSLSDPLADVITGAKNAGDAFNDFIRNVEQSLARIAAQNIAESIFGKGGFDIGGAIGSFFGSGGGFDWGSIASKFAGFFGGGATSGFSGRMASGGPVFANKRYLVGEHGPEVLEMGNQGGRVISGDKLGGGHTFVFNISTPNVAEFKKSQRQVANSVRSSLGIPA